MGIYPWQMYYFYVDILNRALTICLIVWLCIIHYRYYKLKHMNHIYQKRYIRTMILWFVDKCTSAEFDIFGIEVFYIGRICI